MYLPCDFATLFKRHCEQFYEIGDFFIAAILRSRFIIASCGSSLPFRHHVKTILPVSVYNTLDCLFYGTNRVSENDLR